MQSLSSQQHRDRLQADGNTDDHDDIKINSLHQLETQYGYNNYRHTLTDMNFRIILNNCWRLELNYQVNSNHVNVV